jgi:hypothetical protein
MEYTTEELRERKELTDAIVRNLAVINGDENVDLEDVAATTANICHALRTINQNETDLDELDQQTSRICADLCQIDADETNIGELLEQTNEIVDNLTRIKESERAS